MNAADRSRFILLSPSGREWVPARLSGSGSLLTVADAVHMAELFGWPLFELGDGGELVPLWAPAPVAAGAS